MLIGNCQNLDRKMNMKINMASRKSTIKQIDLHIQTIKQIDLHIQTRNQYLSVKSAITPATRAETNQKSKGKPGKRVYKAKVTMRTAVAKSGAIAAAAVGVVGMAAHVGTFLAGAASVA